MIRGVCVWLFVLSPYSAHMFFLGGWLSRDEMSALAKERISNQTAGCLVLLTVGVAARAWDLSCCLCQGVPSCLGFPITVKGDVTCTIWRGGLAVLGNCMLNHP